MVVTKPTSILVQLFQALCLFAQTAAAQHAAPRLLLLVTHDRDWNEGLVPALRREVKRLAVSRFSAVDLREEKNTIAAPADFFVAVRITGVCNTNWGRPVSRGPLGSVTMTNGSIAPSMVISCEAILHAIEPLMRSQPLVRQNMYLARAIVRVIQHELRHILEQTAGHLAKGIFKAHLQGAELIAQ